MGSAFVASDNGSRSTHRHPFCASDSIFNRAPRVSARCRMPGRPRLNSALPGSNIRPLSVTAITVPDHTAILPGERFTKTWALQNAGSVPWTGRRLVWADDELVISLRNAHGQLQPLLDSHLDSLGRSVAVPTTLPGQLVELSVKFAAPLENCSVASIWRLEDAQGRPCFGARCFLQAMVTVIGG